MAVAACIMPGAAPAQDAQTRALSLLLDELRAAGYTAISVTARLAGGHVIEAENDGVAVVIAIDGTDYHVTYSEALTGSTGGFFATPQRPPGAGLDTLLETYAARLASAAPAAPPLAPELLAGPETPNPRTAAFSQSQSFTPMGDGVVIRRGETLGLLAPFTTETETLTTVGDSTTHRVEHLTTFSLDQSSSAVTMGGTGFAQQIFTDPTGFRESLSVTLGPVDVPNGPDPGLGPNAGFIVDTVVSQIETNIARMPPATGVSLPSDLRTQINAQLAPPTVPDP